jgi:MFS family permease
LLLIAIFALGVLSVPIAGGRLSALADLRVRKLWALLTALGIQLLVVSGPFHYEGGLARPLHLFTYAAAAYFLYANRNIPGLWLIAVGGATNFAAIAANSGVMPASPSAMTAAGLVHAPEGFTNSQVVANPNLAFLGDVFALPSPWPLANVFSIGDILIVLGAVVALHRVCESRLVPAGRGEFLELRRHGSYVRLLIAQLISNLGDWVYALAVATAVVDRAGSPHALAALLIAQVAPAAVTGILGGPLIDRFSRKRLMIASDVLRALAVCSLLVGGPPSLVHLYVVSVSLGVFGAIFQPSMSASVPNLVSRDRIVAANALLAATFHVAVMTGPALGGLLVGWMGLSPALAVNACSFLVSALFVCTVRLPTVSSHADDSSPVRELIEGLRYSIATPFVRAVLLVTGLVMVGAAIKSPLEPLFVLQTLGENPQALGLVGAAWGIGMLLGSIAAPAFARRWLRDRLLGVSIAGVGLSVLVASQANSLSPILFLWLIAGAGNAIGTVSYESLLQERTPDNLRGRVIAASEGVLDSAFLIGALMAGWMGAALGVRGSYQVAAVILLAAAVLSHVLLGRRAEQPLEGTRASTSAQAEGFSTVAAPSSYE